MATFSANKFGVNQPPYDNEALKAGFDNARLAELEDFARQAQTTLHIAWEILSALMLAKGDDEKICDILNSKECISSTYRVRSALSRAALLNLEKSQWKA